MKISEGDLCSTSKTESRSGTSQVHWLSEAVATAATHRELCCAKLHTPSCRAMLSFSRQHTPPHSWFPAVGTVILLYSLSPQEFGTFWLPVSCVLLGPHTYPWIYKHSRCEGTNCDGNRFSTALAVCRTLFCLRDVKHAFTFKPFLLLMKSIFEKDSEVHLE